MSETPRSIQKPTREKIDQKATAYYIPPSNTTRFSVTEHPALSVPAGRSDRSPVELMSIGERFADATVQRTRYGFKQNYEWEGV